MELKTDYSFILRFLLVGGSTAFLLFGCTFGLVEGLHVSTVIASTLACVIAICYNYTLHYHWTFASDTAHGLALTRYLTMCAGGVLLNGLVMHFGTMLPSIHYMVVQLVAAVAMVCWSLSLSYFWVFK